MHVSLRHRALPYSYHWATLDVGWFFAYIFVGAGDLHTYMLHINTIFLPWFVYPCLQCKHVLKFHSIYKLGFNCFSDCIHLGQIQCIDLIDLGSMFEANSSLLGCLIYASFFILCMRSRDSWRYALPFNANSSPLSASLCASIHAASSSFRALGYILKLRSFMLMLQIQVSSPPSLLILLEHSSGIAQSDAWTFKSPSFLLSVYVILLCCVYTYHKKTDEKLIGTIEEVWVGMLVFRPQ